MDLFLGVIVAVRKGPISGMCFPWQALVGGNLQGVTGDLFILVLMLMVGVFLCVQLEMTILVSHPWVL